MRGTPGCRSIWPSSTGIIPAYAGNTSLTRNFSSSDWDHPRVCGEHSLFASLSFRAQGSSPRMRGTHERLCGAFQPPGIIPAYAGNTSQNPCNAALFRDHPRVCGEHFLHIEDSTAGKGSSPRMRGTRDCSRHLAQNAGIIPAYAGNTRAGARRAQGAWDHPRVCGEHNAVALHLRDHRGSSPRMRGTRAIQSRVTLCRGIIPAYAGNTRSE